MAGYEVLESALRLQAQEARMMRNQAKPGEHVELEARFTDHGGSGVNRQFWYNAYGDILAKVDAEIASYYKLGYITKGDGQPFKLPEPPRGIQVIAGPSSGMSNVDAPPLYREIKSELPYKLTAKTDRLGWSGPILKTYSKYVSHSINAPQGGGVFRLQINPERVGIAQWQLKRSNPNNIYDSPQHWVRLSISSEAPSQAPMGATAKVYTRYITRHSFHLRNTRVDFSKVYSASGEEGPAVTHEIEVEYIPNTGMPLSDFMDVIKTVTRAMFKTPLLFSKSDLYIVSKIVNAKMKEGFEKALGDVPHINRALLSEARELRSFMLNSSFLFGPKDNERVYNVSLKIDGYRMVYVVDPKLGTWMVYPPYQVNFCNNTPEHLECNLTVFEGEISRDDSTGKDNFWYIDAMIVDGENLRERHSWSMRKLKFESWYRRSPKELFIDAPPIQLSKPTIALRRVMEGTNVFSVIEGLWAGRVNLRPQSAVDGLIFTPELSSYNDACTSVVSERIILKWKDEVTIDLLVRCKKLGGIELFMRGDRNEDVPFRGSAKIPFDGQIIMGGIPIINDSVVEFRYSEGNLIAYRLRLEKSGPNNVGAVEGNWAVSADPSNVVTKADLFCHNATLMRKSHNRIKKGLISEGAGKVLDIGLGRFGDASKYEAGNYTNIYGIDPYEDQEDMDEALKRLKTMSPEFQSKVRIRKMGGHQTEEVVSFVMGETGGEGVDVVVMMDSLTFFFDPERKMLDGLVRTIKRCLKPGGMLIWRCMYGEKVIAAMNEVGVTKMMFGDADYLEYFPDRRRLHVEITPRISQEEYIVRMEEFKDKLGMVGETFDASNEPMLSRDYLAFSRFFCHGTLSLPGALKYPPAIRAVFGAVKGRAGPASSRVLIEAIEKLFTAESHAKLLPKYLGASLNPDPLYFAPGDSEPPPLLFETASQCYFSDIYLTNVLAHGPVRAIPLESEVFNAAPAPEDELYHSLALAYILGIDVFVIGPEGDFVYTNAVEGSLNPCLIATLSDGVYTIRQAGALYPFYHHRDLASYGTCLLPKIDLPRFYFDCGMNEAVLTVASPCETNILERVSHASTIHRYFRLDCLANTLLQRKKLSCDSADIEAIGFASDDDDALLYVDEKMSTLSSAR